MKTKSKPKKLSKIDRINYNYLKGLPDNRKNLITAIEMATLESNFPELKT